MPDRSRAESAVTDPPVPVHVDLRDFPFMPLDVLRLRDSDLATLATGEEFKAAVLLWCAAWHQVPAASLPNDDRWLARHSGTGVTWKRVRREALRGFVLCDDGRLYHPLIAEKAILAWSSKQARRDRTTQARIAALKKRRHEASDDVTRQRITEELDRLSQKNLTDGVAASVAGSVTEFATESVTDSKGQREREGYKETTQAPIAALPGPPLGFKRFWQEYPATKRKVGKPQCLAHWRRHQLEAEAEQICAHVRSARVDWARAERDGKTFEPQPIKYLKLRYWDASPAPEQQRDWV